MEVFISNKSILVEENKLISSGFTMSGNVYLLNDYEVVKLYRVRGSSYNEYRNYRLNLLGSIESKRFVMPREIVYDEAGNIIGYTMEYIRGNNGDFLGNVSSKFLIEELELIYSELSKLSSRNIVVDDLIFDNVIVNESGLYFIDTDDYIIRTRLDYNKNMVDSNFCINRFLKEIFIRDFCYQKIDKIENMFDDYDIFYKEACKYYQTNQKVRTLVKKMIKGKR